MRTKTGTRVSGLRLSLQSARQGRDRNGVGSLAVAVLFGTTALVGFTSDARADEVSPNGKGIVGGALLGAEVVTITEALAGAKPGWAYWLGAGVGAVGGGVAGYFVEQQVSDARIPVLMLAGGISLAIPALVLSLNATRYQPVESGSEDQAPTSGPTPEPGAVGGSVVIGGATSAPSATPTSSQPAPSTPVVAPPTTPAPAPVAPPSTGAPSPGKAPSGALLDFGGGDVRVGIPVPQVRSMYSLQQLKELGIPQQTEYRVSVMHLTF
jgi:hypothetical protein